MTTLRSSQSRQHESAWFALVACALGACGVTYEPDTRCVDCGAAGGPADDAAGAMGGTGGSHEPDDVTPSPTGSGTRCKTLGAASIGEPAHVDALDGICEITGLLEITAEYPGRTLSLPALKRVGTLVIRSDIEELELPALETAGSISLHAPRLALLSAPKLVFAEELLVSVLLNETFTLQALERAGTISVAAAKLVNLSFPELTTVGSFDVYDAPELTHLSLPKLTTLHSLFFASTGIETLDLPLLDAQQMNDIAFVDNPHFDVLTLDQIVTLGSLYLRGNGFTRVSMPHLESVESLIDISAHGQLTSLELPLLAEGFLSLSDSAQLTTLALPSFVSGSVSLNDNTALASVQLSSWTTAEHLTVDGSPALETLHLPSLSSAKSVTIVGTSLTTLELPALETVGDFVAIWSNAGLSSLTLPVLRSIADYLSVESNLSLVSISAPALTYAPGRSIYDNPALTTCTGALLASVGDCP